MKKVKFEGHAYEVPDRATHIARDANDMIYAYSTKPKIYCRVWVGGDGNDMNYICAKRESSIKWDESIQEI